MELRRGWRRAAMLIGTVESLPLRRWKLLRRCMMDIWVAIVGALLLLWMKKLLRLLLELLCDRGLVCRRRCLLWCRSALGNIRLLIGTGLRLIRIIRWLRRWRGRWLYNWRRRLKMLLLLPLLLLLLPVHILLAAIAIICV